MARGDRGVFGVMGACWSCGEVVVVSEGWGGAVCRALPSGGGTVAHART